MSAKNVIFVATDLQQRRTLKKCVAFTQLLLPEMGVQSPVPSSEIAIMQSLLAAYDQSTRAHAQRVASLAKAVARQLRLSRDETTLTYLAALLHDIGKAGIPETILYKTGPLDEHEHQVMCHHPEIGQQMLLQAGSIFVSLAPIVVAHHERWDGGGYPMRMVGEEIPLLARIIAVVDAYDAMIQRRVYHEPQSAREVCVELQRCAGSQFDPCIVAAFLSVLDEFSRRRVYPSYSRSVDETELVDVMCAMPLLQSDECVPASA